MKLKNILARNEEDANIKVAKVMRLSVIVFVLVFVLNLFGVFKIEKPIMASAFITGSLLLIVPTVLNYFCNKENPVLKYIYVTIACLFIFLLITLMTFHVVVLYCYPIVLAGYYFSERTTLVAIAETLVFTVLGQIAGFYFNFRPDRNFMTVFRLIYFSILPRFLLLGSLAVLIRVLTLRTHELLQMQEEDDEKIFKLNNDMISGFATLVENRDENTGGHIKRTSRYVELLAHELKNVENFKNQINDDFIENLTKSAPMHDIGKIAIPDSILQKPGRLSPEEYEVMKTHAFKGGQIIRETFGNTGDEDYRIMAFNVARHHHEKWNGNGYPDKLYENDIPLEARIMAVADVFDALSQKRCYRDALPLDDCFKLIEEGSGRDFDPEIVKVFLNLRPQIEQIIRVHSDSV